MLGVNHDGFTCEPANLPGYIYRGVDPVVAEVLRDQGLQKSDVDLWAIHPGGPKISEQPACSLGIPAELAAHSSDVLARYGNMLSASLVFVLEMMVRQAQSNKPIATGVAFAFALAVTGWRPAAGAASAWAAPPGKRSTRSPTARGSAD